MNEDKPRVRLGVGTVNVVEGFEPFITYDSAPVLVPNDKILMSEGNHPHGWYRKFEKRNKRK